MKLEKDKLDKLRLQVSEEMSGIGPWLAGAIKMRNQKCARKNCACQTGEKKHQSMVVAYREGGKSRTLYIPQSMYAEVTEWIENYRKLKKLLQEGSSIQVKAVRDRDK